MSQQHSVGAIHDSWRQLPDGLRQAIEAVLPAGESPLGWLELDLDTDLNYARGLVVLTARRLLAAAEPTAWPMGHPDASDILIRQWDLAAIGRLRVKQLGTTGRLELLGPDGLLSHWRYTIGLARAAHRLVERFEKVQRARHQGRPPRASAPPLRKRPQRRRAFAATAGQCWRTNRPSARNAASRKPGRPGPRWAA